MKLFGIIGIAVMMTICFSAVANNLRISEPLMNGVNDGSDVDHEAGKNETYSVIYEAICFRAVDNWFRNP